jgi:hypothetical protein
MQSRVDSKWTRPSIHDGHALPSTTDTPFAATALPSQRKMRSSRIRSSRIKCAPGVSALRVSAPRVSAPRVSKSSWGISSSHIKCAPRLSYPLLGYPLLGYQMRSSHIKCAPRVSAAPLARSDRRRGPAITYPSTPMPPADAVSRICATRSGT